MLSNEIGWFDQEENSVGSLTSKLAADATLVRTTLVDRLSTIVQNTSLLAATFILSFSLSWRISVVTLAMFPVLIAGSLAEVSNASFLYSPNNRVAICYCITYGSSFVLNLDSNYFSRVLEGTTIVHTIRPMLWHVKRSQTLEQLQHLELKNRSQSSFQHI